MQGNVHTRSIMLIFMIFVLLLSGCSNAGNGGTSPATTDTPPEETAIVEQPANTRTYTDFTGRQTNIPANPEKIVLLGDNPGDLLALGVKPLGVDWINERYVYADQLEGVADIGYPHNVEKVVELNPDLILQMSFTPDKDGPTYDTMSKIAPVAYIDRSLPTGERVMEIAKALGKEQAAEQWLASYDMKAKAMWEQLGLADGETATVYLSLGGSYYVMGNYSFTTTLYQDGGFKPTPQVQELINEGKRFASISLEVLPEYAGDRIFLLSKPDSDDEKAAAELVSSPLWSNLPAVRNGRAYTGDIIWNANDPITMERLLEVLPGMMEQAVVQP
ncbi:ABC transporter substrate-binding protein [Paenibacillus sp. J5C_2022]|uniref:ABC transporter substrate-binding protein n=1 Tax=Paenibacillus sp. J5C2022 TaxID=2977129 RepID=UPI0021D32250|nr:ABC transporter substrate-binding protein [Paenibacillus sp. J5C2022]MCU6713105.1 ABC transporter substrate-binding protein [Paenibacillus sp. J5C2022]